MTDLSKFADIVPLDNGLCVISTIRRDGSVQSSVVNAGVMEHPVISKTLNTIDMESECPLIFDGEKRSNSYVLVQLVLHLNYHLGQVNYLRRILE